MAEGLCSVTGHGVGQPSDLAGCGGPGLLLLLTGFWGSHLLFQLQLRPVSAGRGPGLGIGLCAEANLGSGQFLHARYLGPGGGGLWCAPCPPLPLPGYPSQSRTPDAQPPQSTQTNTHMERAPRGLQRKAVGVGSSLQTLWSTYCVPCLPHDHLSSWCLWLGPG